jgi:large subunit ribosomal protein L1
VTDDVAAAVREFAAGKLEFRTDAGGNVHMALGKRSFAADKLADNLRHVLNHIGTLKPATVKGFFIMKVAVSGTHTPGVLVAVEQQQA